MKQFNLEEYLANPSRKVVTRDGRSTRIICTDREDPIYPIIALIKNECGEKTSFHTKEGGYFLGDENHYDLFFVSKKSEGWVNIYRDAKVGDIPFYKYIYPSEEEAKRNSGPGVIATTKIEWEE